MYGLEAKKLKIGYHLSRLSSAVNVMLNLCIAVQSWSG